MYGFVPGEAGSAVALLRARHHPDDAERGGATFTAAMASGLNHVSHDYRVVWPDGTVRWLSLHGEILLGPAGEPRRLVGVLIDVTDRKRLEEELTASRERLRLAVEATDLGIWDWNLLTGEMVYTERAKAIYGFPVDRPVTYEMVRDATHPEDAPRTH